MVLEAERGRGLIKKRDVVVDVRERSRRTTALLGWLLLACFLVGKGRERFNGGSVKGQRMIESERERKSEERGGRKKTWGRSLTWSGWLL